jgi:hypothetical protein
VGGSVSVRVGVKVRESACSVCGVCAMFRVFVCAIDCVRGWRDSEIERHIHFV